MRVQYTPGWTNWILVKLYLYLYFSGDIIFFVYFLYFKIGIFVFVYIVSVFVTIVFIFVYIVFVFVTWFEFALLQLAGRCPVPAG